MRIGGINELPNGEFNWRESVMFCRMLAWLLIVAFVGLSAMPVFAAPPAESSEARNTETGAGGDDGGGEKGGGVKGPCCGD